VIHVEDWHGKSCKSLRGAARQGESCRCQLRDERKRARLDGVCRGFVRSRSSFFGEAWQCPSLGSGGVSQGTLCYG